MGTHTQTHHLEGGCQQSFRFLRGPAVLPQRPAAQLAVVPVERTLVTALLDTPGFHNLGLHFLRG
ncbi:hypothetical protein D3C75_899970 [compost metagenome]